MTSIVTIDRASPSDTKEIDRLIAEYHSSEGLTPIKERISWAVDQQLRGDSPGLLSVAREDGMVVGVALAVYTPSAELGRVITVNDFFIEPAYRRKGVGRALAMRLIEECRSMKVDEIGLEVLSTNNTAAAFWKSIGFRPADRFLFRLKLPWSSKSFVSIFLFHFLWVARVWVSLEFWENAIREFSHWS